MEFLQLLYFCSAAETENFAKTAAIYGVPSTGISQSVRRLEKELGVTLFDRAANGVRLNERGKMFYISAKSSLDMLSDAKKKVQDEEFEGTISLLVVTNRYLVNKAIIEFSKKYEKVKFNIDHYRKGHADKYDLMITDNMRYTESNVMTSLLRDDIVLALNKNHPLAKKEKIEIADLKEEEFITYSDESGLFTVIRHICRAADFDPKVKITTDDPVSLVECVENGLGIAMIPRIAYKKLITKNICIREFTNKQRATVLCYNKKKYLTKPVKYFIEVLYKTINEYENKTL